MFVLRVCVCLFLDVSIANDISCFVSLFQIFIIQVHKTALLRARGIKSLNILLNFIKLCGPEDVMKHLEEEDHKVFNNLKEKAVGHGDDQADRDDIAALERTARKVGCNFYTTTIHAVNSAVIKMSKVSHSSVCLLFPDAIFCIFILILTLCLFCFFTPTIALWITLFHPNKAYKVFRGTSGILPDFFFQENEFGVKGGIDPAFVSTSTNRAIALEYAKKGYGGPAILIEFQQGIVNRGADIAIFSQYAAEDEVLFAPLAGLEVRGYRVEDSVIIIEANLTINLMTFTIEQVTGKRKALLTQMNDGIVLDLKSEFAVNGNDDDSPPTRWYVDTA